MHVMYSNDRADYIHSGVLCWALCVSPASSSLQVSYIYCPFSPDTAPSNPCTSSSFDTHFHSTILSCCKLLEYQGESSLAS